jgi:hypothetical protein
MANGTYHRCLVCDKDIYVRIRTELAFEVKTG